ncbi:UNVERIFIED_CONTAM: hypothetical protein GTU68_039663 [Idotea baltica]|nr:hypothetical protein [Idotea baltica]
MIGLSNSEQIRESDKIQIETYNFPGIILMESAGRKSAEIILEKYPKNASFWILAGPGNNGGDGLVIARHLYFAGRKVKIWLSHDPERYKGDAAINWQIISELPIDVAQFSKEEFASQLSQLQGPPVWIDSLLGTGITARLRGAVAEMIMSVRNTEGSVIAIDLPSGLDASTGSISNEVIPADLTLTFQLPKICHFLTPASNLCGEIRIIDIGIMPQVIEKLGIQRFLLSAEFIDQHHEKRKRDAHKGTHGHLLAVGGHQNMAGAISLTTLAAVKSGVGLCTTLTPGSCRNTVLSLCPEAMCIGVGHPFSQKLTIKNLDDFLAAINGKQAIVIGPGLGSDQKTAEFIEAVIDHIEVPLVLDADALNMLAEHPIWWDKIGPNTIITPHPGEMKRLMGNNESITHRLESAEKLANERSVIVILKGQGTVVALPNGKTYVNPTGNPGMATGGAGDVLTGMIGSLLAQGYKPEIAAPMAAFLHGKAGDDAASEIGEAGLSASDIVRFFSFG